MKEQKHMSIRLDAEMLSKFNHVAKYEARSLNSQIVYLIGKCINEYEAKNGKIDLSDKP